ncbi:MAG: hypothetical protein L0L91_04755 [Lactiplantibacillus plantarum]|nr:hypothetical protein [Lactiplantibacillus plantarum]MDN6702831.1 hypothetical protein [Lactiplantibacillus plantarum]
MTALESSWFEEAQQSMHGWDFSHLAGRWQTADLPWDYAALVREHLSADDRWLDIDLFDLNYIKNKNPDKSMLVGILVFTGWSLLF